MKTKSFFSALFMTISLFACKKENAGAPDLHEKSTYRVFLVGNGDTTQLPDMRARIETVGLASADDGKLRAVLTQYDGNGGYIIEVTNEQNCPVTLNWGWDGLNINSGANPDMLAAGETKTFYLHGEAKVGKIKVQAKGDCGNSSTLIINITTVILPIRVVQHRADYDKQTNKTTISFTVEDPAFFDWILIYKVLPDNSLQQAAVIANDHTTKNYSIKL
jgi:hypothetical protein